MFTKPGFQNQCMAFALASGMVLLDDQDGEKERRRARYDRRRARKGAR